MKSCEVVYSPVWLPNTGEIPNIFPGVILGEIHVGITIGIPGEILGLLQKRNKKIAGMIHAFTSEFPSKAIAVVSPQISLTFFDVIPSKISARILPETFLVHLVGNTLEIPALANLAFFSLILLDKHEKERDARGCRGTSFHHSLSHVCLGE